VSSGGEGTNVPRSSQVTLTRWGSVGRPVSRLDGPLKVAGAARFAAEVRLEKLCYAALAHSNIAKGRIVRIETTTAQQAPGVVAVMTHQNAPAMKPPPTMREKPQGASVNAVPVMQDDRVRWNGEAVAVVVAETQDQAEHAASLVEVTYAEDPAALSFDLLKDTAKAPNDILGEPATIALGGDAERALATAAFVVDEVYRTPGYNHNAIEPHAVTAIWEPDGKLTVHDATQALAVTASTLSRVFDVPAEDVRVLSPFVGGGFGGKLVWSHHLLCIAAAKLTGRPVRLALSREGVFRLVGGRAVSQQRVALGAKRDGTLASLIHSGVTGVVKGTVFPEQFTFPARHLYAADALTVDQKTIDLDIVANTAMRAPGESIGSFALESALDELAVKLSVDPIELRRRIEPDKDPTKDTPFSSRNLMEAYRQGADRFGWARRNPTPGKVRDGEWWIGQGVATAYYPYYRMPGSVARICLSAEGAAVVQAAAHEMGMGTATVHIQHAAARLGLPTERVVFEYGDSAFPASSIAGGSSQTAGIAASIGAAHEALIEELLRLAGNDSPLSGADPKALETRDGGVYRTDGSGRGESYASILKRAGRVEVTCEAAAPPPDEMATYSMQSTGAQFCEVRVSDLTGEIRVSRWLGSFDTGRILNPKTARSQFQGGIIMGIGMALMEEALFDQRTGRIMNRSLAEYHVPVHMDVPKIDVIWTDTPDPQAPLGLRGIGEIGITGCAAAIANAVYNATGRRLRDLPMTLDKVLLA
jgi:xanthine dehydrogenase YagR molybdenum-binding subunit